MCLKSSKIHDVVQNYILYIKGHMHAFDGLKK